MLDLAVARDVVEGDELGLARFRVVGVQAHGAGGEEGDAEVVEVEAGAERGAELGLGDVAAGVGEDVVVGEGVDGGTGGAD